MNEFSIMVVDDEEADRYILIRKLRSAGLSFEAFEASDGQEALDFLGNYEQNSHDHGEKIPPLIIFLDINMPLVNGFEFLDSFEDMRASQAAYLTCVIMMFSSSQRREDQIRAFDKQFVKDFIVKGKTAPDEIRAKVESAVQKLRSSH
ncbi:MAG: response regulator [Gammaproteobacteria bacterium]